jgi:hypothetical protein
MRIARIATAILIAAAVVPASAQLTLDYPVDEPVPFSRDSGVLQNRTGSEQVLHVEDVYMEDALWVRLYFGAVELGTGSFLRLTSELDGEVQVLDTRALEEWSGTSAYFNGDRVKVELVGGPATSENRLVIERLAYQELDAVPSGSCGICGPDDRVPSFENFAARLLPAGCSATIYNTDSCAVSAGHCAGGGMVLQFNVPPSNPSCSINQPPVADQFPVANFAFTNGGVGNDWAVLVMGQNNQGVKPFDKYGLLKPLAQTPPNVGDDVTIWGYGVDDQCTQSQVQQTSSGSVVGVSGTFFNHDVDATFGNSGSSLIRNGVEILGIATHCPCPNWATRIDHPNFVAARESLCPSVPAVEGTVTGFEVLLGTQIGGGLLDLIDSDNSHLIVDSQPGGVRNNVLVEITAQSPSTTASELNLTVEVGPADADPVFFAVQLFNHDSGKFDNLVFEILSTTSDTTATFPAIPNPGAYLDAGGEIIIRVMETARQSQTPGGFLALLDNVFVSVAP